ncbi:MAG: TonB-dependent receptor [Acidobacteria bacterium]|nr:TonB-dependent receptor [Acidobacteriota bacterium]
MTGFIRRSFSAWAVVTVVLAVPAVATAQEATITGTIADTTGGVLPGVTVTAVHEATGNTFETVTDERGIYRMPARIGVYRLSAALAGFTTVTRTGVQVAVGQTVTVNLQMAPSSLQETVTVTAEAPLLDVTSSSLGTNITPEQMQELPINGRNWQDLSMLALGNRVNQVGTNEIAAEGTGTYQVNVDGQSVTYYGGGLGNVQPRFSRDAIAEFEFIANRFDATQGRSQGIQINAVTKSGTNTYQGALGGYFRDDSLNAPDKIVNRVLPYSNQQISATHGGPILRDRFHYFANYEFEREPWTTVFTTPFPEFNLEFTEPRKEHKTGVRLDYQFTPNLRATVRGAMWQNDQRLDQAFAATATNHPSFLVQTYRDSDQILLSLTQVLGNRAVNDFKTGYVGIRNRESSRVQWPTHPAALTDNITNGAPIVTLNGFRFGPPGSVPQEIQEGKLSFRDDFTLSVNKAGRHDIRMGSEYIKDSWWLMICRDCTGIYDAQGGPPPANLQQLFPAWNDPATWNLNALNSIIRRYTLGIGDFTFFVDRHVLAGWVQDDWQVTENLTLNLGLRYDAALNAFGEDYDFQPWVSAGRPNDTDNIQPRAGFAYRLNDRTVLRGGFGKYYAEVTDMSAHGTVSWRNIVGVEILNDGRPDFATNPFNGSQPGYEQLVPRTCWDQKANQGGARPGCIRRAVGNNLASPDSQFPYAWQSSIGFQRQIGESMAIEADYVHSISAYNITGNTNINLAYNPATGLPFPTNNVSRLPFPEWGNVAMRLNTRGYDSQNHSVQVGFMKRMSDNWMASATYLMVLDYQKDYPPVLPKLPGIPQAQNCTHPVTWTADLARWVCDVPVNFRAFGVPIYDEDWYRTNHQVHRAVFNGIYQIPYDFLVSGLYFYGDNGWNTTTSGVDVFGVGGMVANRTRADLTIIPRNNFDRKDLHRVDIRVSRRFSFGERFSFEPIAEVFNLFNRANFNTWTLNESNRNFGQPQAGSGGASGAGGTAFQPRVVQLGFRATF